MAKATNNKPGLIFPQKHFDLLDILNAEQEGMLSKASRKYISDEVTPSFSDETVGVLFLVLKKDFDYYIQKYREQCERNVANGKLGGRPPNPTNETLSVIEKPTGFQNNLQNPNLNNEPDIESEDDIEKLKQRKTTFMKQNQNNTAFLIGHDFVLNPSYFDDDGINPFLHIPESVFSKFDKWIKEKKMGNYVDRPWMVRTVLTFAKNHGIKSVNRADEIIQKLTNSMRG